MPEIAEWLQQEQGECTDLSRDSLITSLYRYRADSPPPDLAGARVPGWVAKARERFERGLDELRELHVLYALQQERIEQALAVESAENRIGRVAGEQIELGMRLLTKAHELKMDLGLGGSPHLGTVTIQPDRMEALRAKHGDGVARTLANPASVAKVLSVYKQLVKQAAAEPESARGDTAH